MNRPYLPKGSPRAGKTVSAYVCFATSGVS